MNTSTSQASTRPWLATTACAMACCVGLLSVAAAKEAISERAAEPATSVATETAAWVQDMQTAVDVQHKAAQALQADNEKLRSRLDMQEQRLLDTQRKSIDWWLTAIGVALAAFGLLVAVVGMWLPWQQRRRLKEAEKEFGDMQRVARDGQSELLRIRHTAEQALSQLQLHAQEGAQSLAAINAARERLAHFQSGQEPKDADKVDAAIHQLEEARDPIDQLRARAIKASQIENPALEQMLNAYELWKALTVLDAKDQNAQFNAGYWAQEIYEQAKESSRKQWLATLAQHYSVLPDSHDAANNWGTALAAEANAVAPTDLPAARSLWQQAGEKFAQALRIKPDKHDAAYNWGNALAAEASAVAPTDLQTARALWQQAGDKYAQALRIKANDHEAANNWGIALAAEASVVAPTDLQAARPLWQQAADKYAQALRIKPDDHKAANNWGSALDDEANAVAPTDLPAARTLWQQAREKFAQALRIKPDKHEAANNFAVAQLHEAHALREAQQLPEAQSLLQKAQALLEQHIAQYPEAAPNLAYNLACAYGMQSRAPEAVEQLELARASNGLSAHWLDDADLVSIRPSPEYLAWVQRHFS